jgi:hypothetical protein
MNSKIVIVYLSKLKWYVNISILILFFKSVVLFNEFYEFFNYMNKLKLTYDVVIYDVIVIPFIIILTNKA